MCLTEDHKPNAPAESARIVAAGGHVTTPYARGTENVPRLNGAFSVSRSLGDAAFKLNAEVRVGLGKGLGLGLGLGFVA